MKIKKLWSILLIAVMFGCIMLQTRNWKTAKAATEVEETRLTEDVVYNGNAKITKNIYLNGHILRVNGDLEIAAGVDLNLGSLVVTGNILHTSGVLNVGQGVVEVSGDYRIQNRRILSDGTEEFLESNGALNMKQKDALVKINGNFITQSSLGNWNNYSDGTLEIGGDFVQKNGSEENFESRSNHKIIFLGEKTHVVEFDSSSSGFANLESEGEILWKGYMKVGKILSDLTIRSEKGTYLLFGGSMDVNGKCLNLITDLKIDGYMHLNGGILKIDGNVLHISGTVMIDYGIMEVSGDYRIQNARNAADGTVEYIGGSSGILEMREMDGVIKIAGDFITQSTSAYRYQMGNIYPYVAGTMEIGGDVIQKNGNSQNFICMGSHKVILTGQKPQRIEFESSEATFNTLVLTRPISEYTFSSNPCWKTLEEAATPLSECKIKAISKKAYTGKEIKPTVTVTYQDTKLIQDTDYTLSYANNKNTGKATVTITGIGAYTGSIEKSFQIVPAKVTGVNVTSTASNQVTLTWKKDASATGYVIEYSMDKSFKKNVKKITINKKATTSREITKLTANKTYYFRIRAYKTISGKKAYGAYSSAVSVNVK